MTGIELAHSAPGPSSPASDQDAKATLRISERDQAIAAYVDCIIAVNPAFDGATVRGNIERDLDWLQKEAGYLCTYDWHLEDGRYVVTHPEVARQERRQVFEEQQDTLGCLLKGDTRVNVVDWLLGRRGARP